ncbi:MAG: tRNA uridine-5-carboxymethylaminomethyl(34) synthesis GTPase MnmE [Candidatus Bipolaricaulota bacterium]
MNEQKQDTVSAISTPIGKSGIGIVRLSGPRAIEIAGEIFHSPQNIQLKQASSHTIHYGFIKDGGEAIDEVLLSIMRAPKTYTREDIVEINCHGGVVPLREVLELTFEHGARPAEPGEFTKRAFLNGRITLDQAESVREVIEAKTTFSLDLALDRLQGRFSDFVNSLREDLTDLLAEIEVAIDFPDYEDSIVETEDLASILLDIQREIEDFLEKSRDGKILRQGHKVAILGKPNVGKSTLLNTLLKEDRAIVAPQPGTTRDVIEEELEIDGIPFRIMDTAGIGKPQSEVEEYGIQKAKEQGREAELSLFLVDASKELTEDDLKIAESLEPRETILLLNKIDLDRMLSKASASSQLGENWAEMLKISAKTGLGIENLESAMTNLVWGGQIHRKEDIYLLNIREKQLLQEAKRDINAALDSIGGGHPLDLAELDIRSARKSLGKLLGEDLSEEVLDRIFSRFCVGK